MYVNGSVVIHRLCAKFCRRRVAVCNQSTNARFLKYKTANTERKDFQEYGESMESWQQRKMCMTINWVSHLVNF
jgi:hypothetical protein